MKGKKGISPLIATVLIIGFTIVLAALVITWGTKLFKTTVADTEAASKIALACTTGLKLDVLSAEADGSTLTVRMRNNNQDRDIDNFLFILNGLDASDEEISVKVDPTDPTSTVTTADSTYNLGFGVKKDYTIDYSTAGFDNLNTVDIYSKFNIDGKLKACDSATTADVRPSAP